MNGPEEPNNLTFRQNSEHFLTYRRILRLSLIAGLGWYGENYWPIQVPKLGSNTWITTYTVQFITIKQGHCRL